MFENPPTTPNVIMGSTKLREQGIPEPWTACKRDWVRAGEIDSLDHVNNTVYLKWFENIRGLYLRELLSTRSSGLTTAVKSLTAEFHKEVLLRDEYVVVMRTRSFRRTSFVQDYAVLCPDLRASGTAVVVLLDASTKSKTALPDELRARFVDEDGAEDQR